jgi:hypothetical protein
MAKHGFVAINGTVLKADLVFRIAIFDNQWQLKKMHGW